MDYEILFEVFLVVFLRTAYVVFCYLIPDAETQQ